MSFYHVKKLQVINHQYLLSLSRVFIDADQIALPDFNAGAMENWGLITYRETALLYDEAFSSNSNKQRIASIIAHELAHMVRFEHCKLTHFNAEAAIITAAGYWL